jgi:hypothetical protein
VMGSGLSDMSGGPNMHENFNIRPCGAELVCQTQKWRDLPCHLGNAGRYVFM